MYYECDSYDNTIDNTRVYSNAVAATNRTINNDLVKHICNRMIATCCCVSYYDIL